jgi:hypothetical protein
MDRIAAGACVKPVRAVIATVLHPVERALLVPVAAWEGGSDYLVGLQKALTLADAARRDLARQAERNRCAWSRWRPTTGACARCSICARR